MKGSPLLSRCIAVSLALAGFLLTAPRHGWAQG